MRASAQMRSVETTSPSSAYEVPVSSGMRYDLQGLRGVGILLVVVGHLWRWPTGAFSALDVFFMLSGYFITGLLLDRYERRGSLELFEFYVGRARRLMPTALVVIGVTILLTRALYSPARAQPVMKEGFWAAVFGSNWYFADVGVDYFSDFGQSPFLHYWSLSLEEQFYVVWPALLLGILTVSRIRFRNPQRLLVAALVLISVVSFGYSLWHSATNPTVAYFSTFDRAWQFAAGGLLAVLRPTLGRIPARLCAALAWMGVALIVYMMAFLEQGIAFPAPWGLLPVAACGLLIASGVSTKARAPRFLTSAPLVYVGTISYSLYLWHMPVNYALRSYFVEDTNQYRVIALGVTLCVSVASFHLLERPMRRSLYLMTSRERHDLATKEPVDWRPVQLGWGGIGLAVALALTSAAVVQEDQPLDAVAPSATVAESGTRTPDGASEVQSLRVRDALAQREFPNFDPPLPELTWETLSERLANVQCLDVTLESAAKCRVVGKSDRTAVLMGDSYAMTYLPGIRAALEPHGWTVQQFTMGQCPIWTLPEYRRLDGSDFPECLEHQHEAVTLMRELRPDVLILSSAGSRYLAYREFLESDLSDDEFSRRALGQTLAHLAPLADRTVVVQAPPVHADLPSCVTRFSEPSDCTTVVPERQMAGDSGERKASEDWEATYLETEAWFCYARRCPAFMGRTPVKAGGHLTIEFSESLADLFSDALRGTR